MEYIFLILLGLSVGSFLNVCVHRIPIGESVMSGVSRCPACRAEIRWRYKIPVISFITLRRRCYSCQARISWQYPVLELLTAVVFVATYFIFGFGFVAVGKMMLILLMIVIGLIDLKHFLIPDQLVAMIFLGVLATSLLVEPINWFDRTLGMLLGFGILYSLAVLGLLLFKQPGFGGGDIKLTAALGLLLGWQSLLVVLASTVLVAGGIGLIGILSGLIHRRSRLPFGTFLSFTTIILIATGRESTIVLAKQVLDTFFP